MFGLVVTTEAHRAFARARIDSNNTAEMTAMSHSLFLDLIAQIFVCVVTRLTTAEVQHNDMVMWTNVQNDLRHEMALEMWIVSVHEKSEQL